MIIYISSILASVGTSIITCIFMEAYQNRRATEAIGQYEKVD